MCRPARVGTYPQPAMTIDGEVAASPEGSADPVAEVAPAESAPAEAARVRAPLAPELLRDLRVHLGDLAAARVAVLVPPDDAEPLSELADWVRSTYPDARVMVIGYTTGSLVHAELAAAGPFDVLVEDIERPAHRKRVFAAMFLHLRPGGIYVIPDFRWAKARPSTRAVERWLWPYLVELVGLRPQKRGKARWPLRDELARSEAVGRIVLDDTHLIVTNRLPALAKMREEEMNTVIARRHSDDAVLVETLPPVTFHARCRLRQNTTPSPEHQPTRYDVPELSLREYRDVTCLPGQVAVQGNLALPDSFRHIRYPRLINRHFGQLTHTFVDVPRTRTVEDLPGTYFYLDDELRSHFGHFLSEQVSRLWAWEIARQRHPGLKLLLSRRNNAPAPARWEMELLAAAGVPAADVVSFAAPIRVERLVGPSPMLSRPSYVHPDIARTWDLIGDALESQAPDREYPRRVFISRPPDSLRPCENADEVEGRFRARGFEILRPELLPLPEQAATFRRAEVVAGFGGSGMFGLLYCRRPVHVVVVKSVAYSADNEYMISAVRGHRVDNIVCTPHVQHPDGHSSVDAFTSGFRFDPEVEGPALDDVLNGLDDNRREVQPAPWDKARDRATPEEETQRLAAAKKRSAATKKIATARPAKTEAAAPTPTREKAATEPAASAAEAAAEAARPETAEPVAPRRPAP